MKNQLQLHLEKSLLSQESISLICDSWKNKSFIKKNDYLLRKNTKENYIYFINTGCIALMIEGENSNSILGFGYNLTIITSFISYYRESPTELELLAIYDTEVLKISKSKLQQLINSKPDIAQWYCSIIEKTLVGHLNRQIELTTLTPKDRYNFFIERSGDLVNSIPLKYIASYLNMTPETLSRVRKSIS